MTPIRSEATNAPASDPMPPTTTTTKITEPTAAAIPGSVTNVMPPIMPPRPASAVPAPNTSMKTRGTLWPSASTISGCVSALWMTRPTRVRVSSSQSETSITSAISIMKARVAGNCEQAMWTAGSAAVHIAAGAAPATRCRPDTDELTIVNADPRSDSGGRNSTPIRPQVRMTSSKTTNDRPKVMSSSGTWPNLCTRRRQVRSNNAPSAPTTSGATIRPGQKPMSSAIV